MRRLERADDLLGEAGNRELVDQGIVAGEAVGVEPVERGFDDLIGRDQLVGRRPDRIDLRPEVLELIGRVTAAGGGRVGRSLIDLGHVAAVVDAEAVLAVPLHVEDPAEARADGGVVHGGDAALIVAVVLVVSGSDVEAEVRVQVPLVIQEDRLRGEIGG